MKRQLLSLAIGLSAMACATSFAASVPINLTQNCGLGGTRTVTGSFDASTGAVDIIVTITGCAGRPGDKQLTPFPNGTPSVVSRDAATDSDANSVKPVRPPGAGVASHDGTVSVKGTFLADTSGVVTVNLVDKIDTKVTFDAAANTMTRVCTITRVGKLDATKGLFHGTVTHNDCTMTGDYREGFGLVEHLLRHLTDTHGL